MKFYLIVSLCIAAVAVLGSCAVDPGRSDSHGEIMKAITDSYVVKVEATEAAREQEQRDKDRERLAAVGAQPFKSEKPTVEDLNPGEGGFVVPWQAGELTVSVSRHTGGTVQAMVWRDDAGSFHWQVYDLDEQGICLVTELEIRPDLFSWERYVQCADGSTSYWAGAAGYILDGLDDSMLGFEIRGASLDLETMEIEYSTVDESLRQPSGCPTPP